MASFNKLPMPIQYRVTQSRKDGTFKVTRISASGEKDFPARPRSIDELVLLLKDSVSPGPLGQAMQTLQSTGTVVVDADLEK
jgi:hypothetical protein